MDDPPEAEAVGPPAQVRLGLERPAGGLEEIPALARREEAAQGAAERHRIDGEVRFARPSPRQVVGVGEEGRADFREARPGVVPIARRDSLRAVVAPIEDHDPMSRWIASPCRDPTSSEETST